MSILITGMAMPTAPIILILFPDGHIETEEYDIGARSKAIPIPPHGRLVDMDTLEELIDSCCDKMDCSKFMCNQCGVQIVMDSVSTAPTIIPVEEGET